MKPEFQELATREEQNCKEGDLCTDSSQEGLAEAGKRDRWTEMRKVIDNQERD